MLCPKVLIELYIILTQSHKKKKKDDSQLLWSKQGRLVLKNGNLNSKSNTEREARDKRSYT